MISGKAHSIVFRLFCTIVCLICNSSCSIDTNSTRAQGQKNDVRSVDSFSSLLVEGCCDLDISVQEAYSVSVTADQSELSKIVTQVKDDTLHIFSKDLRASSAPHIKVGIPTLQSIDISGACKASMNGVKSASLKINLDGASKLNCNGSCDDLTVDLSGACELIADKLICKNIILNIDGASNAKIFAKDSLKVDASQASRIELWGNPPELVKNITEAATLTQSGESVD